MSFCVSLSRVYSYFCWVRGILIYIWDYVTILVNHIEVLYDGHVVDSTYCNIYTEHVGFGLLLMHTTYQKFLSCQTTIFFILDF